MFLQLIFGDTLCTECPLGYGPLPTLGFHLNDLLFLFHRTLSNTPGVGGPHSSLRLPLSSPLGPVSSWCWDGPRGLTRPQSLSLLGFLCEPFNLSGSKVEKCGSQIFWSLSLFQKRIWDGQVHSILAIRKSGSLIHWVWFGPSHRTYLNLFLHLKNGGE